MRAILLILGWYYAERFQDVELVWPDRPPSIEEEMQWPVKPPAWWEPIVPLVEPPVLVAPSAPLADIEAEAVTKNRQERRLREESGARRLLRKWLTKEKR